MLITNLRLVRVHVVDRTGRSLLVPLEVDLELEKIDYLAKFISHNGLNINRSNHGNI